MGRGPPFSYIPAAGDVPPPPAHEPVEEPRLVALRQVDPHLVPHGRHDVLRVRGIRQTEEAREHMQFRLDVAEPHEFGLDGVLLPALPGVVEQVDYLEDQWDWRVADAGSVALRVHHREGFLASS